jgi:hypothetical protein
MRGTAVFAIALFALAVFACAAASQTAAIHAIDTAATLAAQQPSAAELILESRQTAAPDTGGRGWIGVAILAIFIISAGAAGGYFYLSRGWMDSRRKYLNAQKRSARQHRPAQSPVASFPPVSSVPRMRPMPQLRPPEEQYYE